MTFTVETFIVRRVTRDTEFQPWHARYLTAKGFKLRNQAFVWQERIDSQSFDTLWRLPELGEEVREPEGLVEVGAS